MLKNKLKLNSRAIRFGLSVLFPILILIVISFVMAIILNSSKDPTKNIGILSLLTLLLSALVGGVAVSAFNKEFNLKLSSLVFLSITFLMFLISLIACQGKILPSALMNFACYFGLSMVGSVIGRKKQRRRKRR